uniref:Uncharacterized protein n=1 Tax=Physcomitrium patens TaxID=3218 RepID=A0A2K1J1L6_PHYPA|nr:hypothetical protein PHYPA_023315 [Physcomitrium patens]
MLAGNSNITHMCHTRAHQNVLDMADYSASKAGLCGPTCSQSGSTQMKAVRQHYNPKVMDGIVLNA